MRKITLLFAALFMAAVSYAQRPYGNIDDVEQHPYLKQRVVKDAGNLKLPQKDFSPRRAMRDVVDGQEPIFDQPEGELMLMRRSGTDYLPVYGSPAPADYTEKGTYVVKGTDGCYYFKNIVTNMCNGGTWVKGTVDDGIIEIETGQISCQLWYYDVLYTYVLFALHEVEATGTDWITVTNGRSSVSSSGHRAARAARAAASTSASRKPPTIRVKVRPRVCQKTASPTKVKSRPSTRTGVTSSRSLPMRRAAPSHTSRAKRTARLLAVLPLGSSFSPGLRTVIVVVHTGMSIKRKQVQRD